ncbi:hypothetical protein [Streptomyces bottropensis]|uniref:hypothetical protein n=1 Tax=Streptomyces bottropensis TaxID=42235 RepID=UPI0036868566
MPAPRTRSRKQSAAPQTPEPPVRPAWQIIEEQVWAATRELEAGAVRTVAEPRTLGPYRVFAHIGFREDGTEFLISAHLSNPQFCIVASMSPLDANGAAWRHRTSRGGTPEVTTHTSLMDAANAAFREAVERGAWAAEETDAVEAAYVANPRRVLCEACGR